MGSEHKATEIWFAAECYDFVDRNAYIKVALLFFWGRWSNLERLKYPGEAGERLSCGHG